MQSLSPKSSVPAFLKVDIKKDGPKLLLLVVVAATATYMWTRAVEPSVMTSAEALSPQMAIEVTREYQVTPLPQPPVKAEGRELLIAYVPVSRANPFDPLISQAVVPTDGAQGANPNVIPPQATSSPIVAPQPVASVPAAPSSGSQASGSTPIVPKTVRQTGIESVKVRAIGEASGIFSAVIQMGEEAVVVGLGDSIAGGVKVKQITSDRVIFQRGMQEFIKRLEEGVQQ